MSGVSLNALLAAKALHAQRQQEWLTRRQFPLISLMLMVLLSGLFNRVEQRINGWLSRD
ncbi:hypothetical protein [Klebsiella aerogenes]|uniref:hypothetical protein n=1 Tax=Klebsiella aerogenes TaxID=548 RepID=UPI0027622371|nr:hypothetical protein [Klebsiella aerogenes]HBV9943912.1 hypothetical protein [Klebsiella aerogenes]HDS5321892.1 hypothetical protein [Klebsiella aerogenes]